MMIKNGSLLIYPNLTLRLCYTYDMKITKGSSVIVGLVVGLIIGVLMDNLISFLFLGLMFGLIGETVNKKKTDE